MSEFFFLGVFAGSVPRIGGFEITCSVLGMPPFFFFSLSIVDGAGLRKVFFFSFSLFSCIMLLCCLLATVHGQMCELGREGVCRGLNGRYQDALFSGVAEVESCG